MLGNLFPKVFDNQLRGQKLALIILIPLIFLEIAIGAGSIISPMSAMKTDAIDMSTYSDAARMESIATMALLGLFHVLIGLLGLLALLRYRAMIPLIYLMLLLELLGRKTILHFYPVIRTEDTGAYSFMSLAFLSIGIIGIIGLLLSVWPRKSS